MLTSFTVKNFKGFKDEFSLNLSNTNNYEFSTDAVRDGIVNKAIIYGHNGCGKTNLGLALFDVVLHLTDKQKMFDKYQVYLNLDSGIPVSSFKYQFLFSGKELVYSYTKTDMQNLKTETLEIDGNTVMYYDFVTNEGFCKLDGTQSLKMTSPDSKLSKLKFIKNNAILVDNSINSIFYEFMDYVDHMLMFYSLMDRGYQGLVLGTELLDDAIVKAGKLKEFENFLHKAEIHETLVQRDINGQKEIDFKYKYGCVPFGAAASAGTKSLELFFYWYMKISEASLVFIDEFDAFYHYELSELIVKELLKNKKSQVLLTTHNTDLLSNDLLRPDCYFQMSKTNIKALSDLTLKEIRKAHNIQKMYKAGAFEGER